MRTCIQTHLLAFRSLAHTPYVIQIDHRLRHLLTHCSPIRSGTKTSTNSHILKHIHVQ